MVGVPGIGIISGPANPKRADGRGRQVLFAEAKVQDQVLISDEGQEVSAAAQLVEKGSEGELREKRIAEVWESLEQSTYKLQEVVLQVAARIARYSAI